MPAKQYTLTIRRKGRKNRVIHSDNADELQDTLRQHQYAQGQQQKPKPAVCTPIGQKSPTYGNRPISQLPIPFHNELKLARYGNKITAIKEYRTRTGARLVEAKNAI